MLAIPMTIITSYRRHRYRKIGDENFQLAEPVIGWLVLQEAAVPASHYPRPRRLGFTNYDYYIYEATFRCVQYLPTRPRSSARY